MESPYPTEEQLLRRKVEDLEEQVQSLHNQLEEAHKAFVTVNERVDNGFKILPLEFSCMSSIVLTSMIDLYTFAYAQMGGYSGEKRSHDELFDQALDHIKSILHDLEKQQEGLPEGVAKGSNVLRMFQEAIKHAKHEKRDEVIKGRLADVVE